MNIINIDTPAITETVKLYFDGTYHGDRNLLQQAFHPDSHITGIFNGETCSWTLNEFISRVTETPTAAMQNDMYDKEIIFIDHAGCAAAVKARVVIGANIFIDYITLLKINNTWVIRNKSFTTWQLNEVMKNAN
jgi:hypothetical protein